MTFDIWQELVDCSRMNIRQVFLKSKKMSSVGVLKKKSKCFVREKKSKCPKKNFQSVKKGENV